MTRRPPHLTKAQAEKLESVPPRLHGMYREAVTSRRRAAAIRVHCLECVDWLTKEVRLCSSPGCVLHPYRLGGYPGNVDPQGSEAADPSQAGRQPAESPIGEGATVPLPTGRRSGIPGPRSRSQADERDGDAWDPVEPDDEDGDVHAEGGG